MPKSRSLSALLKDEEIDWKLVQSRLRTAHFNVPRNLVHKLCLKPDTPPSVLQYALQYYGKDQLTFQSGLLKDGRQLTPLEICLQEHEVSVSTFEAIVKATIKHYMAHDESDNVKAPLKHHMAKDGSDYGPLPLWIVDMDEMELEKLLILFKNYPLERFEDCFFEYLLDPLLDGNFPLLDGDAERFAIFLDKASQLWGYEVYELNRDAENNVHVDVTHGECTTEDASQSLDYSQIKPAAGRLKDDCGCGSDIQSVDDQGHKEVDRKKILVPHTYLHIILQQNALEGPISADQVIPFLEAMDEHFPEETQKQDSDGNTLLHLIFKAAHDQIKVCQDEDEDDFIVETNRLTPQERLEDWMCLMDYICNVFPEWITVRNLERQTPLHVALEKGLPGAYKLAHTVPDAAESKCGKTFLFPFQLAAVGSLSDQRLQEQEEQCFCDYCRNHRNRRDFFVAEGPIPGTSIMMHFGATHFERDRNGLASADQLEDSPLTTIYQLLRMAPHVLQHHGCDSKHLDSRLYQDIVQRELKVARLDRLHHLKMTELRQEIQQLRLAWSKTMETGSAELIQVD
jgi:hypothetical protein